MCGTRQLILAVVAALATTMAVAAPPDGKGGPPDGTGGGKPSAPDLLGDMVLIDRDINGVPITTWALGPKDKWEWVASPIMFGDKVGCPLVFTELQPVAGNSVYTLLGIDARYIPFVDGEIPEEYGPCSTEADFGRLSAVRSPDNVLNQALTEMVTTLSTPDGVIGLDEAGRLLISTIQTDPVTGLEVEVVKTIDAPASNVAGFERLLEAAELSHPDVNGGTEIVLPVYPGGHADPAVDLLDRAAAMLGGASDKFGEVGLDELVYTTQILTIAGEMSNAAITAYGEPWDAAYFNFEKFEYDRALTYAGDVCYLKIISPDGPAEPGTVLPVDVVGQIVREPILPLVFPPLADASQYLGGLSDEGSYAGFTGTNAWAFARAADDARAVIQWVHDHPVPIELVGYCGVDGGTSPSRFGAVNTNRNRSTNRNRQGN